MFSVHPLTICLLSTERVTSQSSQRDHQRQNSGLNNFPSCTVQYQRNIDECQCKPGFSDVNWHGGGRCDQAADHTSNEVQQNVLLKIPYTQTDTHNHALISIPHRHTHNHRHTQPRSHINTSQTHTQQYTLFSINLFTQPQFQVCISVSTGLWGAAVSKRSNVSIIFFKIKGSMIGPLTSPNLV